MLGPLTQLPNYNVTHIKCHVLICFIILQAVGVGDEAETGNGTVAGGNVITTRHS